MGVVNERVVREVFGGSSPVGQVLDLSAVYVVLLEPIDMPGPGWGRTTCLATYDGRLTDLDAQVPTGFISIVSDDWEEHFRWRGLGDLPDSDVVRLRRAVEAAHSRGWRLRFWNVPAPENGSLEHVSLEHVWTELLDAEVDLVSVDHLEEYADFVEAARPRGGVPPS